MSIILISFTFTFKLEFNKCVVLFSIACNIFVIWALAEYDLRCHFENGVFDVLGNVLFFSVF